MAPLPRVVDPNLKRDRLPQPYRMLDKLLAEIVQRAFAEVDALERQRECDAQWEYDQVFHEKSLFPLEEGITACCTSEDGSRVVVGTKAGRVLVVNAGDCKVEAEAKLFEKPIASVTAFNTVRILQADQEAGKSVLLVGVCTREQLMLCRLNEHHADPNGEGDDAQSAPANELAVLGKARLPSGAGTNLVLGRVTFSPEGGYLCFSGGSGAVALFCVPSNISEPSEEQLVSHLWVTEANARELLGVVPSLQLGHCNTVWQQTDMSRPGGKRAAKGLYLWWSGHNRLLLLPLSMQPVLASEHSSVNPAEPDAPPVKPTLESIGGWVGPVGITAVASTKDGAMLGLGLSDGAVMLYNNFTLSANTMVPAFKRGKAVTALAFLDGRGVGSRQLLVGTAAPSLRVLTLENLEATHDPVAMQAVPFSLLPALQAPLVLVTLANGRVVLFNAESLSVVGELTPRIGPGQLAAPVRYYVFQGHPPVDEEEPPSEELMEVQPRETIQPVPFLATAGPPGSMLLAGLHYQPPPVAQEDMSGKNGAAETLPAAEQEPADELADTDRIDEVDAVAPAKDAGKLGKAGAPKAGAAVANSTSAAEPPRPKRLVLTQGVQALALFSLKDVAAELVPEEDVMSSNPLMIERMLGEAMHELPPLGADLPDESHRPSARGDSKGNSKQLQFVRGVTPKQGAQRGGDYSSTALGSQLPPAVLQRQRPEYEPSDAGTGISGHTSGTSIGGDGVGLRVAKPVPGASAAVAERVLGRLGEAGGRRARNRMIRKHMKDLSEKLLLEGKGQAAYLAPVS